jgi:hypothetical protein
VSPLQKAAFRALEADSGAGGGAPVQTPEPDNSAIRAARQHAADLEQQLKDAKAQLADVSGRLTEKERAEMAELDRLKAEKADADAKIQELEAFRDEAGRYQSRFKGMYEAELASIPEEQRARAEKLTSAGTFAERFEALQELKAMFPAAPVQAGTRTNVPPAGAVPPASTPPPPPASPKEWGSINFADAVHAHAPQVVTAQSLSGVTPGGRPTFAPQQGLGE